MNSRRGFFKTLFAGALAAVLPKPALPTLSLRDAMVLKQYFEQRRAEAAALPRMSTAYVQDGHTFYDLIPEFDYAANLERANRHLAQLMAGWAKEDLKFLSGDKWKPRIISPTSADSSPELG